MGGGNLSRYNRLFVFFDVCQSKARSGYGVIPVSKAMLCRQQSYASSSAKLWFVISKAMVC